MTHLLCWIDKHMYVRGTQRVQCRQSTAEKEPQRQDKEKECQCSVNKMCDDSTSWASRSRSRLILNTGDYAQSGPGSPTNHPPTLILHVHRDQNLNIHSSILNTTHIAVIHNNQWTCVDGCVFGCSRQFDPVCSKTTLHEWQRNQFKSHC